MKKLLNRMLVILAFTFTLSSNLSAKEKPISHESNKVTASERVPFNCPLTDNTNLGQIITAIFSDAKIDGLLASYPAELISAASVIKSGKKTISIKDLQPIMPFILKRIAPHLLESDMLDDLDYTAIITRARRIKDGCNESINKDVTHPVTMKSTIDLESVIKLLCIIQKDIERCCKKLCKKIDECCEEIIETITECCEDLINLIDESTASINTNIDDCCDELSSKIDDISFVSDEIIFSVTECCEDLSNQINESSIEIITNIDECCDELSSKIEEIDMASEEIIATVTECCEDLNNLIIDSTDEINTNIDECCNELNTKLNDLENQLSECCNETIETITECCDDLTNLINDSTLEITANIDECCDELTAKIEEIDMASEEIIATVTQCCEDLTNLIIDSTNEINTNIDECCNELNSKLDDLEAQLSECCDETIETITECCDNLTNLINDSTLEITDTIVECCDEVNAKLDDLETQLSECCNETIATVTECCEDLSMQLEESCENLDDKLGDIQEQADECCEEIIETVTECCDDLSNQITESTESINTNIEECCENLDDMLGDIQNQIDECCEEIIETITECCEALMGENCGVAIKATDIPYTVTEPGNYFLQDTVLLTGVNATAILINDNIDNVVIDLCCNTIIGDGDADQAGIAGINNQNITIKNGNIDNMQYGILLTNNENIELSNLKMLRCESGVFLANCVNSLVKNVAAYECTNSGFTLSGSCADENRNSKNNCFIECQVYNGLSTTNAYGFISTGGQNNSFIECVVKDIATTDDTNASTAAGFCLGTTTDGMGTYCNECGTSIIDCEVLQVTASETFNNGGSTPYGIKLESVYDNNISANLLDQRDHGTQVNSLSWAPSGCYVATAATSNINPFDEIAIWEVLQDSGQLDLVARASDFNGSQVNGIDFSPDGCFIVSVGLGNSPGFDDNLTIWEFDDATGSMTNGMSGRQGREAFAVSFSPNGCFFAVGSNKNTGGGGSAPSLIVSEVDKENGTFTPAGGTLITDDGTFEVRSVAWSPDGNYLASGDNSGEIKIWSFDPTQTPANSLTLVDTQIHGTSVNALDYSPDGCFLASGADAAFEVVIWKVDKTNGELTSIITQDTDQDDVVNELSWSHDGKQLATAGGFGSDDLDVKIWTFDPTIPSLLFQTGYAHGDMSDSDFATSVAYSPTDCFLASGAQAPDVNTEDYEGQVQIRTTGIIYPKECLIKRNEITRISGGCGGFGIQGGCNNLFINNLVYEADQAYIGVTNVYAKGLGGTPNAFDNAAFPPTCTQGQCNINRSFKAATKNIPKNFASRNLSKIIKTHQTKSPTSAAESSGSSIIIRGLPFIIRTPGTYILATSGQINGGPAITITASNVTLDLGGHTIQGEGGFLVLGTNASYGISTLDGDTYENITILNGTISDMSGAGIYLKDTVNSSVSSMNIINSEYGIQIEGDPITDPDADTPTTSDVYIEDVRASENDKAGFLLTGVSGLTMLNTSADNNGHDTINPYHGGYVIQSSLNIVLENNIASANSYGYYLSIIHNGALRSCGALYNTNSGFYLLGEDPGTGLVTTKRLTLQECKSINNKEKGIYLNAADLNTIVQCESKSNTEEGIYLSDDSNFNLVNRAITANNGAAFPFYPGIFDGSSVDMIPITTNRVLGNFSQNNGDGTTVIDAYNDNNYTNAPAISRFQPVTGGTALSALTVASAGLVSNIST